MSKLAQIRKALRENPSITIIDEKECNYLTHRDGFWSHTVDIRVVPKGSGVYGINELQKFMMSLIPELKSSMVDNFRDVDGHIVFGKLYFDEVIGTETIRREIVLTDKEMFACNGFIDGRQLFQHTNPMRRRTWVRLFPNTQIATRSLEGTNILRISKRELLEMQGCSV